MKRRGFSLLEVMVAIAILGLTLTVILSAQGGLAASNRSAANMGQAVALGRCKMTEIEEKMMKLGFPEIDAVDPGVPCCDDDPSVAPGFTCDTRIEKIEMPNFQSGNSLGDGGALIGPGASSSSPLAALANPAGSSAGLNLDVDGGLQGLGSNLASQFAGPGGAGAEGLLNMVMGIVYPAMKPMYEASIRRITVTVKWKEGPNDRELPLIQYLTNPQRGGFAGSALLPDGGAMDFAPPTSGSASPSGTSAKPGTGTGTGGTR
jgi:general secretion pathway protein I